MEENATMDDLYNQICILRSELTSSVSDIGDYRIIKTYEARLLGKDDPYDTETLIAKRQAIRDKIDELIEEYNKAEAIQLSSRNG